MAAAPTRGTLDVRVATMTTTLEIDARNRWEAVDLLGRLAPYRPHLIQLDFPDGRWLVRAQVPGTHGEGIVDAVDKVEEWHRERAIPSVGICVAATRPLLAAELRRVLRGRARTR
jgi:hypothetical protein